MYSWASCHTVTVFRFTHLASSSYKISVQLDSLSHPNFDLILHDHVHLFSIGFYYKAYREIYLLIFVFLITKARHNTFTSIAHL